MKIEALEYERILLKPFLLKKKLWSPTEVEIPIIFNNIALLAIDQETKIILLTILESWSVPRISTLQRIYP